MSQVNFDLLSDLHSIGAFAGKLRMLVLQPRVIIRSFQRPAMALPKIPNSHVP